MENQPIFTNNTSAENAPIVSQTPQAPQSSKKPFNLKAFGIGAAGVVALAAVTVLAINFFSEKSEFIENGGKSLPNLSESRYVDLKDYDLALDSVNRDFEDEIQEKITFFFSYLKPEMKTLTMVSENYSEFHSEDGEDASGDYRLATLTLKSDTNEKFLAKILTTLPSVYGYELVIEDDKENEIYTYKSGNITKDLYANAEYDSLLDVILDKLPYKGEIEGGAKFEITYEGEEGDRLTVSPLDGSLSTEDCKKALAAAAEWAKSLELKYAKEITESNFTCKL